MLPACLIALDAIKQNFRYYCAYYRTRGFVVRRDAALRRSICKGWGATIQCNFASFADLWLHFAFIWRLGQLGSERCQCCWHLLAIPIQAPFSKLLGPSKQDRTKEARMEAHRSSDWKKILTDWKKSSLNKCFRSLQEINARFESPSGRWVTPDTSMSLIEHIDIYWYNIWIMWKYGLKSAICLLVLLGLHTSPWWKSAASRGWQLWNKDVELLVARCEMTNDLVVFKRLYSKEIRRCSALSLSISLRTSLCLWDWAWLINIYKHNVFANSEVVWNVSVNQMKVDYRRGLAVATRVGRDMHTSAHTDMLVQTVTDAHETNTCLCTCGGSAPCQDTPKANMPSTQVVIAGLLFAAALDRLERQRATDFIRVRRFRTGLHRQILLVQALLAAAIYSYVAKMKMPRLPDIPWLCLIQELKLGWHGLDWVWTTAFIPYLSIFDSGDPLVLLAVQELQSARDRAWFETQKHHQLVAPDKTYRTGYVLKVRKTVERHIRGRQNLRHFEEHVPLFHSQGLSPSQQWQTPYGAPALNEPAVEPARWDV